MNIIMAAGDQTRWVYYRTFPGMSAIKQLVDIHGKPLIVDIQDKTGGTVVTNDPDIRAVSRKWFEPAEHRFLAESILSSMPLFDGKLCVFLGDVFYTPELVAEVEGCDQPIAFWGANSELFAMAGCDKGLMTQHCQLALNHAFHGGGWGMLWDIYRSAAGLDWRSTEKTPLYHLVTDPTVEDFDAPCAYREWRERQ